MTTLTRFKKVGQVAFQDHLFQKPLRKMEQNCSIPLILADTGSTKRRSGSRTQGTVGASNIEDCGGRILTPELIVVAAALRLPAAVSRLTDVALVVNTFTVQ